MRKRPWGRRHRHLKESCALDGCLSDLRREAAIPSRYYVGRRLWGAATRGCRPASPHSSSPWSRTRPRTLCSTRPAKDLGRLVVPDGRIRI